jgi:hypothetical protein
MTRITRTTAAVLALAAIAVPTASASVADKPVHHARAGRVRASHRRGALIQPRGGAAGPAHAGRHRCRAGNRTSAPRTLATPPTAAGPKTPPEVMVVEVPQPMPASGLDWGDAGIGAGGLLGLRLLGLGGTLVVARRRELPI